MISYGKQTIIQDDIDAVIDVLKSDKITQGPVIEEFEKNLATYCNSKYAVVVNNGTAALHLANLCMGVSENIGVLTSPITFLSTSNSVIMSGGKPFFADIDLKNYVIDPNNIYEVVYQNPNIRGIIPVHLGGVMADIEKIYQITKEKKLWIIEDACHAIGGEWIDSKGIKHKVGDCSFSDLTIFSFHPVKQITTGEGGAITTNSKELYKKLLLLRTHGMTKDPEILIENHGSWYYEMHSLGYNYRITDFQCALGIQQLKNSDSWVSKRKSLVVRYKRKLRDITEISHQNYSKNQNPSFHLYIILALKRDELFNYLQERNIHCQIHYFPIHLQPYYKQKYNYKKGDFPKSELYYKSAISLPLYPSLTIDEQNLVIESIKEFYGYS